MEGMADVDERGGEEEGRKGKGKGKRSGWMLELLYLMLSTYLLVYLPT